ncbi:MAG: NAD(P)-binding protein, partial [Candidatus Caenarcaniphilales bacterium]|nr:NAD(P)-binding protein [Candidatus Caenarcaniphilales bacterium]
MQNEVELLIIGGGISGLSAAFCAQREGKEFLLLEASNRLGGCIWTDLHKNEYILERGPNSLALGVYTEEIIQTLKIPFFKPNLKAKNKLVYSEKKLHPVSNPMYLFGSNFLSWKAKLSFFKFFKPKWHKSKQTKSSFPDENIEEFFNYCF